MSAEPKHDEYPSPAYAWYVVGVLTLAYVFSFIDRQILSLLVKPIQRDLEITDTQMSLLMGLSFAVFYTFFGIPLGRLADTRSRRTIVSLGIAFWSVATAGCGLARKFWELAVMRMGVGIGEATLSPAAYSLIADYFPPQRRSTAMGVYSMGIYVGSGLAFILGGLVARLASNQENYVVPLVGSIRSWQLVFFVVGLPGLLVALLLLTVAEPSRKGLHAARPSASLRETWAYLCENGAALVCLNCGIALVTLNSYASTSWIPTLFERRFGWNQGSIGLVYGAIVGVCGTMGVVAGGWWADRWSRHGRTDAPLRVAWLATLCGLPCTILYPLARSGEWTALLLVPMVFCGSMPFGVAPAAIQRMMPNTMRAQATAIYLFVINLIGMGMGPTLVALGTEHVFHDKNSVHHSLLIVGTLSYLCAGVLLGISLKSYRRSLEYLDAWTASRADQACPAPT